MKIAILTNQFPPVLDGVGDYAEQLAREFGRHGHTVSVLCRRDRRIEPVIGAGNTVSVSPTVPGWDWRAVRPLRRFLVTYQPDWLLVQYVPNGFQRWGMPLALPVLLWIVRRYNVKVSLTFHEVAIRPAYWPPKYAVVAGAQRLIAWALARLSDRIITSIDRYAGQLRRLTREPISLIPIGANIGAVPLSEDVYRRTQRDVSPDGGLVISTFGVRNQDLVLDVFNRVRRRDRTARLLICGPLRLSATGRAMYERLAEHIVVTGYLPAPDVTRYLASSDVFFLPDPVDNRGRGGTSNKSTSLATALALGLPVVGIRGDMNNTLLKRIPGVFLEAASEPDAMAERLLAVATEVDKWALSLKIRAFFENELSWPVTYRRYVKIIPELAHQPHQTPVTV